MAAVSSASSNGIYTPDAFPAHLEVYPHGRLLADSTSTADVVQQLLKEYSRHQDADSIRTAAGRACSLSITEQNRGDLANEFASMWKLYSKLNHEQQLLRLEINYLLLEETSLCIELANKVPDIENTTMFKKQLSADDQSIIRRFLEEARREALLATYSPIAQVLIALLHSFSAEKLAEMLKVPVELAESLTRELPNLFDGPPEPAEVLKAILVSLDAEQLAQMLKVPVQLTETLTGELRKASLDDSSEPAAQVPKTEHPKSYLAAATMDPRGPRTHSYHFQDTSGVLEVISRKIEEHEEGVRTCLKLLLRQVHFFIEALGSRLGISEEAAEARAELIAELEKKRCLFKEAEQNMSWDLRLFVDNLPVNVDVSKFVALLLTAGGEVRMVRVFSGKITGRNSGFGFVTMSSAEEAQAAAQRLNGSLIGGRAIRVTYGPPVPAELLKEDFKPRGRRGGGGGSDSSKRLYVGNLPFCVDDQALWTLFSKQGKVLEARVKYCRGTNTSRGFGFVTYSSTKEVNNALSSLNGFELAGRKIRVSVAEEKLGSF